MTAGGNSEVLIVDTFELWIGGMKDDFITALAPFIVLHKYRTLAIGNFCQFIHFLRCYSTHFSQYALRPFIVLCREVPPQEKRQVRISAIVVDSAGIRHEISRF